MFSCFVELTERDEFVYHEMMAHVALCSHRNPENVLIVGGGDGGILREVCRDENVKHITLVEIDPMVIDVTKRYLQNIVPTSIFDDPRLEIIHVDGAEFVQDLATSAADTDDNSNNDGSQIQSQQQQQADSTTDSNRTSLRYDVILADTLDPLGPAESLFEPEFYEAMHTVLRDDGLICTQGECFWIHLDLIRDLLGCCTDIYDYAEYASTMIPSAPCGQMGFIVARKLPRHHNHLNKNARRSFRIPLRTPNFQSDLRWYNSQVHQAAFVLPEYIRRELGQLSHDVSSNDDEDDGEDPGRCFLSECTIL